MVVLCAYLVGDVDLLLFSCGLYAGLFIRLFVVAVQLSSICVFGLIYVGFNGCLLLVGCFDGRCLFAGFSFGFTY